MVNGGSSATSSTTAELTPGVNVPFNIAWRVNGSNINIAMDGTAETQTVTAIGVPDLSTASISTGGILSLEYEPLWGVDVDDPGLVSASNWSRA